MNYYDINIFLLPCSFLHLSGWKIIRQRQENQITFVFFFSLHLIRFESLSGELPVSEKCCQICFIPCRITVWQREGVHLTACKSKLDLGRYSRRSEIISGVRRFHLNTRFLQANIGWKTPETSKWWTSETLNPGNRVAGQVSSEKFLPSVIETFKIFYAEASPKNPIQWCNLLLPWFIPDFLFHRST